MATLLQDSRYSVRMLAKAPGFALVAILTLTLGIGANAAIFQLIDAVRLRTLPVQDPNTIAIVHLTGTIGVVAISTALIPSSVSLSGNRFASGRRRFHLLLFGVLDG
jgi:hypothetical protein